jgi:hypothetical protein
VFFEMEAAFAADDTLPAAPACEVPLQPHEHAVWKSASEALAQISSWME